LATIKGPVSETYYISDAVPMQFKDFITRVAATQNVDCSKVSTGTGIMSWFKSFTAPTAPIGSGLLYITDHTIVYSDKKARKHLGYHSVVSFDKGLHGLRDEYIMALTTPRVGLPIKGQNGQQVSQ